MFNIHISANCGPPRNIQYATSTSTRATLEGDVVTYKCAKNTVPEGITTTTCLVNGTWSYFDLYCRRKYYINF